MTKPAAIRKKRFWGPPTLSDRKRVCRARVYMEPNPVYVVWNKKFKCWGIKAREHILVAVTEVLSEKK